MSKQRKAMHTPGPWTVTPGGIPELFKPMTREEHEANKRLIAAAPDLLGALKEALEEGEYPQDVWGRMIEAIAKAEGRSNEG